MDFHCHKSWIFRASHSYFEQTHVKEKLQDGVHWNIDINVHWQPPTLHSLRFQVDSYTIKFLTTNYSEDEKYVGRQRHGLQNSHSINDHKSDLYNMSWHKWGCDQYKLAIQRADITCAAQKHKQQQLCGEINS